MDERGIHVPEDVSVVSFDDAELTDNTDVKLLSAIHPENHLVQLLQKFFRYNTFDLHRVSKSQITEKRDDRVDRD